MEPRKVIGSIDTSEFLVAVAASLGFLLSLGTQGVNALWAVGLLAGGVIAAPIAAWLVRHVPPRLLGSLVGGMIVLTNARTLLKSDWLDAGDSTRYAVYAVLYLVWAAAVVWSFLEYRKDRAIESADAVAVEAERRAAEAERNVVADVDAPVSAGQIPAGRPSAPRD
jgi:hypothetical protein